VNCYRASASIPAIVRNTAILYGPRSYTGPPVPFKPPGPCIRLVQVSTKPCKVESFARKSTSI
jgi:hypothetical protein